MSETMLLTSGSICRAVGRSREMSFRRGFPGGLLARFGVLLMWAPGRWQRGSGDPLVRHSRSAQPRRGADWTQNLGQRFNLSARLFFRG